MKNIVRWSRIALELIGAYAIVWFLFFHVTVPIAKEALYRTFNSCSDSHLLELPSPGGSHVALRRLRECGEEAPKHLATEVTLRVPGDTDDQLHHTNFMRVVGFTNGDPDRTTMTWTGPNDLLVTIPKEADIEEAYGIVFGVNITLRRSD